MSDVRSIVKEWLREHGYGGLYVAEGDCYCDLDDLIPCLYRKVAQCKPGYKLPGDEEGDWHIGPTKGEDNA
jgi:hypothetical protein